MDCDNCGKPIRFPLKDARIVRSTSSYEIIARYYCEVCYPKMKSERDPYGMETRKR